MYRLVNGFMLLKPSMDIANVPEFYKLFNSSSFEVSLITFYVIVISHGHLLS